jgi:hypothetical protein
MATQSDDPPPPEQGDPGPEWWDIPDDTEIDHEAFDFVPDEPGNVVPIRDGIEPDEPSDTFPLLTIAALESMPPPAWLVHEVISEDGLTIIYGEPGSGKSFIALDMALRLALGIDWHGLQTQRVGVLYIAGEGARGIGKRITGWRLKHRLDTLDAPFVVLPIAVQVLDPEERAKLIRTIDEAKRQLNFDVVLIVLDTVSRSIAGADENGQDTMTGFVQACDEIKRAAGGALIGIHHCGKDRERGMRGSSVLLGAVDASLRISKDNSVATVEVEKQKDAEEGAPVYLELEKVQWDVGGETVSTLVPMRTSTTPDETATVNRDMICRAFAMMADAWATGRPLSSKAQTRRDGRYAPAIFRAKIGGEASAWDALLMAWLDSGAVAFEVFDKKAKVAGLRVLDPIY